MRSIMAELMGKKSGSSLGKGGSMHLYMPQNRFYGGNGIVGAQVPVGAGIALQCKYNQNNDIVVTMFGDGAANQGQVYETANIAALWKLPLIFLIENNQYGMGTSIKRAAYETDFYTRGHYIPGVQCDGLDVVSARNVIEYAAEHCRSGKGPIFVEMKTYRYHGHSMSDPGKTYRSKIEVQNMRKKQDPIIKAKQQILDLNWASEKELKEIDAEAKKEAEDAVSFGKSEDEIDVSERFNEIYMGERPKFIRATDRLKSIGRLD